MYSIQNRDYLEKLEKLQGTKASLKDERLKRKLRMQDFYYDMEEVFISATAKQVLLKEATENQKNQTNQIQAIQDQTREKQESSNAWKNNLQKSFLEYDENTNRENQLVTDLVNLNQVDSNIVRTISNLLNDKHKSQFSLELLTQSAFGEGNPNFFKVFP